MKGLYGAAGLLLLLLLLLALCVPRPQQAAWQEPWKSQKAVLIQRREALRAALQEAREQRSRVDAALEEREAEVLLLRQECEATALKGPGVELRIDDAPGGPLTGLVGGADELARGWSLVHDQDILRLIAALRAAGAEAMAVNGVRLTAHTRIRCGGPIIYVGTRRLAPPYRIEAIGPVNELLAVLLEAGLAGTENPLSLYDELLSYGLDFTIKRQDSILIPAAGGEREEASVFF